MARHELIEIGELDYAFGLVWRVLNEGSEQELVRTGRRFSWTSAVTLGKPIRCAGYADKTLAPGSLSAAARLSQVLPENRTCMVVEDMSQAVGQDVYWFVVIQDGVIYPDTDVFVQGRQALQQQTQPFREQPELAFFGNACAACSAAAASTGRAAESIHELLGAPGAAREALNRCRLRRLRNAPSTVRLLAVLGAACLIGATLYWQLRKQEQQGSDEAGREARRHTAAQQLQEMKQAALSGPNAQDFNDLTRGALHQAPFYVRSWRLGHIACDSSGCHRTWLTDSGALRPLAARLGRNIEDFEALQDGRIASAASPHSPEAGPILARPGGGAPGARNHLIELCQRIRKFSAQCTIREAQPVQFEHSELLDPQQLYSQGQFTVQAPLAASGFVAAWLTEEWIRPEQLRLDFNDMNDPQWTMEGRYVTQ